jgi:transcriptional regulator with GAF, ATPase, and Fis domain
LSLLSDMTAGSQTTNGAIFIARNTPIQDEDADLGILMLSYWTKGLVQQIRQIPEKAGEAQAIIQRARSLQSTRTPREIASLVDLAEAEILDAQGNITLRDSVVRRAIKRLPATSPRLPWMLAQYALMLSRAGRLSELSRRLSSAETSAGWPAISTTVLLANFVNQVETCNVHQAEQLLGPLSRQDLPRPLSQYYDNYRILLPMLRNALSISPSTLGDISPADDITPDWALVIRSLSAGNSEQALKWARISEKRNPLCLRGNNLVSLNLVRAELAERNIDAARRLLSLRRSQGNSHYLDSLFEARALLLEGSLEPACEHFCSALKDAAQHNAKHRLELEMTLAVEIPHHLVMLLAERAAKAAKPKQPTGRIEQIASSDSQTASGASNIVGASHATEEIRRTVMHFARMDVPVLITGETGTGKDLIAHAIHEESTRLDKPFVAVNCASISESLLESELFGHEKGAFTGASATRRGLFEQAGDGCIFLDEIGEISPRLQAALLRVLETGEIRPVGSSASRKTNCRILAATNADLARMSDEGSFRQDILFRLKRLEIQIPPLRERTDDLLPLSAFFLNLNRTGDSNAVMSEDLCRVVLSYSWPGNVRELRNIIERMRLMNSDKLYYEVQDIGLPVTAPLQIAPTPLVQTVSPSTRAITRPQAVPVARIATGHLRKGRSKMRRLEAVRTLFSQHRTLTRSEIIDSLAISPNIATSDLRTLISEGFVEKIQPSKSPRSAYFKIMD